MEPRELRLLASLLRDTRVLALGVLVDGQPQVGLLPFLATPDFAALIVHGSRLARHSRGLSAGAPFSAVLHQPDTPEADPLRLPRLLLDGEVTTPLASEHDDLVRRWVARFPSAAMTVGLGDFAFHRLVPTSGRLVAGFGQAFGVGPHTLASAAALADEPGSQEP
jgi:hypothetical protein